MTLRNWLQDLRMEWRRWRRSSASSQVFTAKIEKREVASLVTAYERTGRDGIFSCSNGEINWNWLQNGEKA
jgi:hypothetical protein